MIMRRIYFLVLCLLGGNFLPLTAQTSNEDGVRTCINQLFIAMQKGDSSLARSVFTAEVTLASISRDKSGSVNLERENSIDDFIKAIGTPHQKIWYEEIWNLKIEIDLDLAQAWCDYAFYLDNTFSHCGADAFHLVKTVDGWKIFHLADTRRKVDCKIPREIQSRHQ